MTEPLFRVCPLRAKHSEVKVSGSLIEALRLAREMANRLGEEVALYSPKGKLLQTLI